MTRIEEGKGRKNKLMEKQAGIIVAVFAIFLTSLVWLSPLQASALSDGVNISENEGTSSSPQIATSGSNVYVVWQDNLSADTFVPDILFAASADDGVTFSDPVNVSENEGTSSSPQIATSGSNVYVVWQDDTSGNSDILFAASADDGVTFSDPVNVSDDNGTSVSPRISVSNGNINIAWQDSSALDILFSVSDDGATFSNPVNVSDNEGTSSSPQIASSGSNVYVLWQDDTSGNSDILFAASADDGANFDDSVNISNNSGFSTAPEIAASDSNVYIAWQDDNSGDFDILFAASADDGVTFSHPDNVSENDGLSSSPKMAISGDNIQIVWSDDTDASSGTDIRISTSTDNGASFSAPVNVSDNDGSSVSPQVLVSESGEEIYAIWTDNELGVENNEIFLSASTDGGTSFGCPIDLSATASDSSVQQAILASDGHNVHTTWQELIDLSTGNFDVFAKGNTDPLSEIISINPPENTTPKWDMDEIGVSGRVSNAALTDSVTVEWGDGTTTDGIPIEGCSWGPVSHTYESSAVEQNPNILVAKLIADDDSEKASSTENEIVVQKHATSLVLDSIASVKQGDPVSVSGSLVDFDKDQPIEGMTISFNGSGAEDLDSATTDGDGQFSASTPSANATEDGLEVQAHFDGTSIYDSTDSDVRTYDTASESADEFAVAAGKDVVVDLADFNATVIIGNVTTPGTLFVSECESEDNDRFIALDNACLRLSPGFQMGDGTASVNMSFAGKAIPEGFSAEDVDLFHEVVASGSHSFVDSTQSRDTDSETVVGVVTSFSNFHLGAAVHDEKEQGHHTSQVFVGDGSIVSIRDITNHDNSSATASLDKSSYKISDNPIVTVEDANGNVDPSEADVVYAGIRSETSDPNFIVLKLIETGNNSNTFDGTFAFTRGDSSSIDVVLQATSGDELDISYVSGARFQATVDGVVESGLVDLSDYIVEDSACFRSVGSGVDLEFVDSALGSDGNIAVTMSYANDVLGGIDPSSLVIWHKVDSTWNPLDSSVVDLDEKTVSASTQSPGPFSLGTPSQDCAGGAGGGAGFGRGVVVDFVASLANRSGGGGGSGTTSGGNTGAPSGLNNLPSGQDVATTVNVGSDIITVEFDTVESSSGPLVVNLDDLSDHVQLFDQITTEGNENHGVLDLDGTTFSTAGNIFDIDPSGIQFDGMVDVTIPYDENDALQSGSESDVRLLHYNSETNEWDDVTVAIDTNANTVSGTMNSLSPVVAATANDGTFGAQYFEVNPLAKVIDANDSSVIISNSDGTAVTTIGSGENVQFTSSLKNVQRTSQQYSYILEVLDSQNVVIDIVVKTGSLNQGQTATITSPWTASNSGTYTFKILLLDDLNAPMPMILKDLSIASLQVN